LSHDLFVSCSLSQAKGALLLLRWTELLLSKVEVTIDHLGLLVNLSL